MKNIKEGKGEKVLGNILYVTALFLMKEN